MENFKFTPEQLEAITDILDFSTPSKLIASIQFISDNIGRGGDDVELPECLQRDALASCDLQWEFGYRTEVYIQDLHGNKLDAIDAYLETEANDPEQTTGWTYNSDLNRGLRIYGTSRRWLIELMQDKLANSWNDWNGKVEELVKNIECVDVVERHARKLEQRVSDLQELVTKAMRERMSWQKTKAMKAMNMASDLEAKMRKGYELNMDDVRELKAAADSIGDVNTHGLTHDRQSAIRRLINDEINTFRHTAHTWLEQVVVNERQEDVIVAKLVELEKQGEEVQRYYIDNKVVVSAINAMQGELRQVTRLMTEAGWSRDSIQEDIANAKQALEDLAQVRDLFIDRLSEEAKKQLAKVSIEDIVSQLDALAGVVAESNQETAEA